MYKAHLSRQMISDSIRWSPLNAALSDSVSSNEKPQLHSNSQAFDLPKGIPDW